MRRFRNCTTSISTNSSCLTVIHEKSIPGQNHWKISKRLISRLREKETPEMTASTWASRQIRNRFAAQVCSKTTSGNIQRLDAWAIPKLLHSGTLRSESMTKNAALARKSQKALLHPVAAKYPGIRPQDFASHTGIKPRSPSSPTSEPEVSTAWEAFLEEHPVARFFLLPESARQKAYLNSSILWGQMLSNLFRVTKVQLHKWLLAWNFWQEKGHNLSNNKNSSATPQTPCKELEILANCNFMNAFLFAGPFNIMPKKNEHCEDRNTKATDVKVRITASYIHVGGLPFSRTQCLPLSTTLIQLKETNIRVPHMLL